MPVSTPAAADIYSVSRLNREVRAALEEIFPSIWVQGEISNLAKPASGHLYFTLKDSAAQVRCAMFRNRQTGMRFEPENGLQVLARANIGLYEGRGEYQLIIESLQPAGAGALQLAYEALKQKLASEGLFETEHKQALPLFPQVIGIITSPTGAALRDILHVTNRRYPACHVIIYPVPVQGEGAANKIARMISLADQRQECDVLMLGRGGGSLEDLWSFNEEIVARAIFECETPLVAGIGHEIDFTISDFVADQRAPTPSAAAELVTPDQNKLKQQLEKHAAQIKRAQKQLMNQLQTQLSYLLRQLPHPKRQLQEHIQHVDELAMRIKHYIEKKLGHDQTGLMTAHHKINRLNPANKIKLQKQALGNLHSQLNYYLRTILANSNNRLANITHLLETVSPMATLERGYAIVSRATDNSIIRDSKGIAEGDQLHIQLAKAEIEATTNKINEK